jgi:hypothetical protein
MNQTIAITLKILRSRRFSALAVLAGMGLLFTAAGANAAGCAVPYKAGTATAIPYVNAHPDEESNQRATIVGLWHVIYTGSYDDNFPPGGPYPPIPFQFLETFKTWHADGTEFENALLPPSGAVCYGVWKELGENRVKLHHIGALFAADGSVSSFFTTDEVNTVAANGKSYSGSFDFKLWPPSYEAIGVGTPIAEVKGTTAATRIIVD